MWHLTCAFLLSISMIGLAFWLMYEGMPNEAAIACLCGLWSYMNFYLAVCVRRTR